MTMDDFYAADEALEARTPPDLNDPAVQWEIYERVRAAYWSASDSGGGQ